MIVLSPYSRPLRNGEPNPKDYPLWHTVVKRLGKDAVLQIGTSGEKPIAGVSDFRDNLSMIEIEDLIHQCDTWMSVDNFLPHMVHCLGLKPGVVVYGKSDPNIFGYPENRNLLRNRRFLRKLQFDIWEREKLEPQVFVTPTTVVQAVLSLVK